MIYPEFSPDAFEDRHRLPLVREAGTCGVSVRLASPSMFDHSSWRIIRLRVMDVLRCCVEFGDLEIGGCTITGGAKRVELTLYSTSESSDLSLMLSNNTIAVGR